MNGLITVIVGPMFTGKTKRLIKYYHDLKKANKKLIAFKPALDNRYSETEIVSHDSEKIPAWAVKDIKEIRQFLKEDTKTILIDEIQLFFSEEVVYFLDNLAKEGKEIIVTGLDWDEFTNAPFPLVAGLLSAADEVLKLAGTCEICGDKAIRTQWKLDWLPQKPSDYVGGAEKYGCRCRLHFHLQSKKFVLVLISGPSGVGKSEVVKRLSNYQELNSQQLINATTRPPRDREIDGQHYHFVSREEFLKGIDNNQFLNHVEYNNNYYGTPLDSLKKGLLTRIYFKLSMWKDFKR